MLKAATTLLSFALPLAAMAAAPVPTERPAELLEQGIYAEETRGDVGAAIALYERVVSHADAQRSTAAQALLRLGVCQRKLGRTADAISTFRKLAAEYPEQESVLARVPHDAPPLTLKPAPWTQDEVLVMRGTTESTSPLSESAVNRALQSFRISRTREVVDNGRRVLRIEIHSFLWLTTLDVDPDTLLPISHGDGHPLRRQWNETAYSAHRLDQTTENNGERSTRQYPMPYGVYDPDSVVHIVRRLPLGDGYRVSILTGGIQATTADVAMTGRESITVVAGTGGIKAAPIDVAVVARETITVPAGTFDAYKVRIGAHDWWFSADEHRYPLRSSGASTGGGKDRSVRDLIEVRTGPHEGAATLSDGALRLSLTVPSGWMLTNAPAFTRLGTRMTASGMRALGGLRRIPAEDHPSVRTLAQLEAQHHDNAQTVYWKRHHSLRDGAVDFILDGLPARQIVCDYGDGLVEYVVWVLHGEHRVLLWFDVKKEAFAEFKPIFDEMVASLRVRAVEETTP
jgi:hypothetical protein